jgi:hypothetical protein
MKSGPTCPAGIDLLATVTRPIVAAMNDATQRSRRPAVAEPGAFS